jgi:predicted DNA-binding transcriptional regulator AlpA
METTVDILSRKETAQLLGICLTTLDRLDIPRTKVRHRVMFKREAIGKWIDDHTEKAKREKI